MITLRVGNLLLIYLFTLNMVQTTQSIPNEDPSERRRRHNSKCDEKFRHNKDRLDGWIERITEYCKYPGQFIPCLIKEESETNEEVIERMARKCCGGHCLIQDIESICCRTPTCSTKCYPTLKYRHHIRNIKSLIHANKVLLEPDDLTSKKRRSVIYF